MANRIIEELIKCAKEASLKNRGQYGVTIATNVYKKDGSTIERKVEPGKLADEEIPEADIVLDLSSPDEAPIEVIIASSEGAIIAVSDGEIASELKLEKDLTLQGVNAGIAQNYDQEVK